MTHSTRLSALFLAATLAALPACTTKTIGPSDYHSHASQTSFDQGAFVLVIAPSPETLARPHDDAGPWIPNYRVFIDGRRLINGLNERGGYPPIDTVPGLGATRYGFIEGGAHHFAIADEGGGPFRLEADVVVLAGGVTRLYMFGPEEARRGMWVPYPMRPPPDTQHVLVANVVLDDTRIEVVSCDDASQCTPVSGPIGPGEMLQYHFALTGAEYSYTSLNASGAGIGVRRVVPSTEPTPTASPMGYDTGTADLGLGGDAGPLPVNWATTIMYAPGGSLWGSD